MTATNQDYRIISRNEYVHDRTEQHWDSLPKLDELKELLEKIEQCVVFENEDGTWCSDCACIDDYNPHHHETCIVTKAKAILKSLDAKQ